MSHPAAGTIAAVATARGPGSIGIVRISGPRAPEIGARVFRRRGGGGLLESRPFTLVLGDVIDPGTGEVLDEALAVRMPAGRSYTGEETVEIQAHGGPAVMDAVLAAALASGARLAAPGEFTRRAFLGGRIDLLQAEAVADLIAARTAEERRAALGQLASGAGAAARGIRARVLDLAAAVEAQLEFEEEEGLETRIPAPELAALADEVRRLVAAGGRRQRASRGARVVVAGRANCGKSSLFNWLSSSTRAIVTDEPGTTRDYLEAQVILAGADVLLVDTAGLRVPAGEAEAIGISRSVAAVLEANLVLQLIDGSVPFDPADLDLASRTLGQRRLVVMTKCDLPRIADAAGIAAAARGARTFTTSVVTGEGCGELAATIAELARELLPEEPAASLAPNTRQTGVLSRALVHLDEAAALAARTSTLDRVAEELRCAIHLLDEVTGEGARGELLDRVFARFCVGK